ncbi:hypothetical protein HYT24_02915 [Candidatus Pacearchaeota archaeon]|nr:hypothetical protein [Candidatus Pacearchaeota archaeon]
MSKGFILVAEEDIGVRRFARALVDIKTGYPTDECETSDELGRRLEKGDEDLALVITNNLDIVRKYAPNSKVPFLLMSGQYTEKEAKDAGAYGLIPKPFTQRQILGVVENALERRV